MTQKRIYDLAYAAALQVWAEEDKYRQADPNDLVAYWRERKAWKEVEEIRAMALALEKKAN